jgi:D-3-phosphoglycerate dehydrogenase
MITIMIADKLAPEGAALLRAEPDVTVVTRTGLSDEALAGALREADGVVVRSAVRITGPVLHQSLADGGGRLRAIARAGVGVDNIDVAEATRLGVVVMNTASASTITTAEHAFALMIALARNIGPAHAAMAAGGWDRSRFTGTQLHGKTLGVVGLGRIGRILAERALSFGMQVIAFDPFVNAATALEGRVPLVGTLPELLGQVDIASFHVPRTPDTAGMLDDEAFAAARPGLLVVNAARGGIVDEPAMLRALESGRCGGAALDVYDSEPPPADSPLRNHPRILTTPHLGASTVEAQEAVAVDACRAMLQYLRGQGISGAVNLGSLQMDLSPEQRRFTDLGARMVRLLNAVAGTPGFTSVRFTVRGEALAGRADTVARHALAELLRAHLDQPVNVINAALLAGERGIESETRIAADHGENRLTIEIRGDGREHRIDGAVYADGRPRVTSLDGYAMDMVAEGSMVLLTNLDQPGRIGLVGRTFGDAGMNIAAMVIGRRPGPADGDPVAMMVIKLDEAPPEPLLAALGQAAGILKVASVVLPGGESKKQKAKKQR